MIVSINQPAYLPWLGYFHRINIADVFVFFNTTQFEKNSMVNRNKIKTPSGSLMLSVPVNLKDHISKEIRQIKIADTNWAKKHWKAIELNYRKAQFWNEYAPSLKKIYEKSYAEIEDVCYEQLMFFTKALGIKTKIIKSCGLSYFCSKKQELVLDICKELRTDTYISGALGRDYMNLETFRRQDIKVYYHNYQHPCYKQLWGKFLPYMSVIDLLFNCGSASLDIIMSKNINKNDLLTKNDLYE
ncbi:hypothetical protein COU01_02780 [Candidatus Falkowbacteria bacterium CG10_big_fil_rev_8_21_14_0_10_44_15]|uniref:WbqC family protein n=1 Tax=Candidatus Falkowbacteria bacterium CG10_big_fil_rev_8_21_14_0_10_44_15 TaxID=1974569 RepID=A0A2H0UZM5_9BACT|nr:MAG: hypothetical protein COU01_02780 [Candidatus Falkowbacteria bacterium CG10_big_fil_rev_8_21_14_0_10_44_15]